MQDLQINQGDTCYITVIKQDDSGNKINFVTGETVVLSAKKNLKQTIYDIQTANATLTDGEMIIEITSTESNIALGDYYYDIQYTDVNNDIYTLVKGMLNIDWQVTDNGS